MYETVRLSLSRTAHEFYSVPRDYDDLLAYYTKHGYRVIAIAGKSIEGLSWLKAQRMKRLDARTHRSIVELLYSDVDQGNKQRLVFTS
jgi:hypothetical protein